jgi:hypothetical protein
METETQRRERRASERSTTDPLPERAKSVICHASSFSAPAKFVPDEFLEVQGEIDPDGITDEDEHVHFERGEKIPLELAREIWDDLGDLFEPIDGHAHTVEDTDEELTQDDESRAYRWE